MPYFCYCGYSITHVTQLLTTIISKIHPSPLFYLYFLSCYASLTRKKGGNNNKNKASFGVVVFLFASPLLLSTTAFTTTAALGGGTSSSLSTRTNLSASSSSSSIVEKESETETGNKMSGSSAPIITFEDIAKYPGRAFLSRAGAPTKIVFGPDDDKDDESNETSLIYLGSDGNTLTQKLWKRTIQIDSSSSSTSSSDAEDIIIELAKPPDGVGEEDTLSAEEKLRRERTRQLETGITNFEYSGNKKVLLCPIGNDLFIKRSDAKEEDELIQIVDSSKLPGSVIDPHISYDGTVVVFVCNNELYSVSTITNAAGIPATKQLTFDAAASGDGDGIVNGLADFIAMEGTYVRRNMICYDMV